MGRSLGPAFKLPPFLGVHHRYTHIYFSPYRVALVKEDLGGPLV